MKGRGNLTAPEGLEPEGFWEGGSLADVRDLCLGREDIYDAVFVLG